MGIQEEKPDLNLEYFSTNGNSATFRKDMDSDVPNSLQLTMGNCNNNNTIHIDNEGKSSPARSDHLQANSESLSECGGPSLQLMSCSMDTCSNGESSVNNSGLQLMSEGSKREFSFLGGGYFQKGKKRRQEDGNMCRRSPSVRSSTPPPMSPAYNGSSVSHVSGGHQFHLQESSQSSVQKPVATIQPVQVQGPVNQHSCSSIQSSLQCSAFHEPASDLAIRKAAVRSWGNQPLSATDPDLWDIMEKEKQRQWKGIELIASENFVCQGVIEALGSHLTNKYSEGMPGSRYYGGNEYIDQIESLCCERALTAFRLDPEKWGVNVQPYSCTSANFAVYTGLLQPKDRIMGLDSPSGGHLSHGYYTSSGKKVSGASIFFESLPYKVNPHTGYIDFEKLEEKALDFRPKILICGGSSYPREWDYARFRQITDKCGAVLMCDMAQISGLVAAGECSSPFDYCDIVTSTTHKSLRGPRGGMIFYRKGSKPRKRGSSLYQGEDTEHYDFEEKINFAVFPSLQGGPHNNHVAALAVAFKQAATPEYKAYIQQVKKNAQALASTLLKWNCRLVTGGTDNHLLLWDLRPLGLTGNRFEKVCETCHITVNKNAVFGDSGAMAPGGVRIGTPAMTSRGCVEKDFKIMAEFLVKAAQIATNVQREHGKIQRDFLKGLQNNKEIAELRASVEKFASQFEMPGFDTSTMKYNTT